MSARITYTRGTDFHTAEVEASVVPAFTRRLRSEGCQVTSVHR